MHISSYLTASRHNVFYFRWPLPKTLHPCRKPSDIKLSLRTKDFNEAMHLSRLLAYTAHTLSVRLKNQDMRYDEIRDVLRQHFAGLLKKVQDGIAQDGRLNDDRIAYFRDTISHIDDDSYFEVVQGQERHPVHAVIEEYGLPFEEGTPAFDSFKEEYKRSRVSFCQEVLDYDASLNLYDLKGDGSVSQSATGTDQEGVSLGNLVESYVAERVRGNNWTPRTESDYRSKFALLFDIVSKDTPCTSIDAATARHVKETLQRVPKNIKTSPRTRRLSFDDALALENIPRMDVKTVNAHLAAYNGLFRWAEANSYIGKNVFAGLTLKQKKGTGKAREAFTPTQARLIYDTIVRNERGLIKKKYQFWGPLIGLYTGARLNEIAQLTLEDIRQQDGIWCFSIDDQFEGKTLKTASAKRLIPIHSDLLQLGLIEYVETLRASNKTRLLHELGYSKGTGYGRNLSRWFNGPFLSALGMDTHTLVFHSLRHTMVTNLLQSGVAEPLAKSIIGHAQEGVTQTVYFGEGYTVAQKQEAMEGLSWKS